MTMKEILRLTASDGCSTQEERVDDTVRAYQDAILAKGWQFIEHVFTDGSPNNCYVEFTNDRDPLAFMGPKDYQKWKYKGWGRFARLHAWRMAYECIVLGRESD